MTRSQQAALTLFAVGMVALGVLALIYGDFALVWQPVPSWVPGRTVLAYGSGLIMLLGGIGLLFRATASWSVRILFPYLIVWLCLKLPALLVAPQVEAVCLRFLFGRRRLSPPRRHGCPGQRSSSHGRSGRPHGWWLKIHRLEAQCDKLRSPAPNWRLRCRPFPKVKIGLVQSHIASAFTVERFPRVVLGAELILPGLGVMNPTVMVAVGSLWKANAKWQVVTKSAVA
jgi:hypothetical protein